jgi:hypothetical protein
MEFFNNLLAQVKGDEAIAERFPVGDQDGTDLRFEEPCNILRGRRDTHHSLLGPHTIGGEAERVENRRPRRGEICVG